MRVWEEEHGPALTCLTPNRKEVCVWPAATSSVKATKALCYSRSPHLSSLVVREFGWMMGSGIPWILCSEENFAIPCNHVKQPATNRWLWPVPFHPDAPHSPLSETEKFYPSYTLWCCQPGAVIRACTGSSGPELLVLGLKVLSLFSLRSREYLFESFGE